MRSRTRLGRKVQVAFASAILVLLVVGAISWRGMAVSKDSEGWVRHTYEVMENLQDMQSGMEGAESAIRGYALTGKDSFLVSYRDDLTKARTGFAAVRDLTVDNPRQQRRLPALQKIFEQKIQFAQTVIGLRQTLGTQAAAAAIRNGPGQEVMAEFQGVERAMRDEELRLLVLRYADANRRLDQTKDILLVGTLLGVLIAAFAGLSAQRFGIRRGLAEDALRDSESRFRQMAESISDAFFLMEADSGKMLYVSPAYEQMSGRTRESLYADSKSWTDAMHPDDRDAIREKYKAGIAAGEFEYETRYLRPGGVTQWVKVRGYPVRNDAGEIVRIAGVVRDITERKLGEQDLRESERRFSGLLGSVQLASVMLDSEQRITYCNEYLLKLTGWTIEEVIGRDWVEAFVPVELHATMPVFAQLLTSQAAWHRESEILTRSGERRLMRWNVSVLRSGTGDAIGIASIGEDITEQKKDEIRIRHLNRVYAVLSGINTLIVRVQDRDALFREACRIAVEQGGFRMAMIGIVDPVTRKTVPAAFAGKGDGFIDSAKALLASDEDGPNTLAALALRTKEPVVSNDSQSDPRVFLGEHYAESGVHSLVVMPLMVADQAVGVLVLYACEKEFFHEEEMKLLNELAGDVAFAIDHIEQGDRLTYLAYYDSVTGFANQTLFLERLQEKLLSQRDQQHRQAVFVIDIERFKSINDAFGRKAGDELLKRIAERFVQAGGGDASRFARLGADRFAIVASGMDSVEQVGRYVEQRLDTTFRAPFRVADHDLRVFVKVGIAMFPDDGIDAETLLRNAEAALKKAKQSGERYLFFTQKMTERVAERLSLENRLRQALDNEEFVLHYQPKINLGSGLLTGCEALLRWNDPQTGLVPPMQFIPILEETGLIHEVGQWAMRKAIEDYLRWRNAGLAVVRIAVNVSPLQLRNRSFVAEIEQALGIDPQASSGLELEITESLIMEDVKHSIASLLTIRAMGVTIAIDDFGTGFSSLSYLSKLPVDTLKIDRSFIIDMTAGPDGLALVSTIINLAHSLKLKVVAEGVETEEQSRLLRLLSCDEFQGYLFSKPVPGNIFEAKFLSPASKPVGLARV